MTAPPAAATPPIFLWDAEAGELRRFETIAQAERHLAPWQEVGAVVAWDARGRVLTFAVEARPAHRFLFFWTGRERVVLTAGGEAGAPSDEPGLRQALRAALTRRGTEPGEMEGLTLDELVARATQALARGRAPCRRA